MTAARPEASIRALAAAAFVCLLWGLAAAPARATPSWLAPAELSAAGRDAEAAQVAVDPQGDAVAVWQRSDGNVNVVQSANRPAGGSWSAAVDLSAAGHDAEDPQVAVDPQGDATAIWWRTDGANAIVQSATRPAGGSWSEPVSLSETGHSAFGPQIAVDPQGDAVAIWWRYNPVKTVIQSATRPAGGSWSAPQSLSAAGQDATEPQVAVDSQGDAVAVWLRFDGANWIAESANRPAGGGWSAATPLSKLGATAFSPDIAVDPHGDALAAWRLNLAASAVIQVADRPAGGNWSMPTEVSPPAQASSETPQVALDATGNATAIWWGYNGTDDVIQSASRVAGGGWSAPMQLSAAGGNAEFAHLAVNPRGDAVAVWQRDGGAGKVIQSATRPAAGGWSAPADLSAPGQEARRSAIAVDSEGNALATWQRNDGADFIVQAAGYDGAGPQLRSPSIPASGAAGQPLVFSVSPFDAWSALGEISWSFGAGAVAGGAGVSHTFDSPGNYQVTVGGVDVVGNASSVSGPIAIWQAAAGRIARVKGGKALVKMRCNGSVACRSVANLSVAVKPGKRHGRTAVAVERLPIGKVGFAIAGGKRQMIRVALSRRGRSLLRAAGRRGRKAQLNGTGIEGRAVVLRPAPRRHHHSHRRDS